MAEQQKVEIFRKESLDKLQSPEQLDQVIQITSARGWMLLAALCVLLGLAVTWSVFGRVATKVTGTGMLLKSGGVLDVVTVGAGQITAVYVDVGDDVQRGQIVARIAQPELSQKIETAKDKAAELERQHAQILQLGATDIQLRKGYAEQQRVNLAAAIRANRERLAWLTDQLTKQRQLEAQGLVTKSAVQSTVREIQTVQQDVQNALNQMRSVSVDSQEARGEKAKEQLASELRMRELRNEIAVLEERLEQTSRVISSYTGRVLEVRASAGDVAAAGQPVLNIEPAGSEGTGLEAMIYVPLESGKSVKPGMRVKISPASVRKETYGVMLGIVTSVSEFGATEEGMKRLLENRLLVQSLLEEVGQAPIAVTAELVPSANTVSGYRWSSNEGPPSQLGPGTPCTATITVKTTRPIERVIPLLSALLGD